MTLHDAIKLFIAQATITSPVEWIAIATGVAEVLLARANKVLLYPAGIISTALYTWLFIRPETKLYADAILNLYYFIMSIYGWVLWVKKVKGKELQITASDKKDWVYIAIYSLGGWALLYLLLTRIFPAIFPGYTASEVAMWDALISATAWVGMWLLARRKIENWVLLNVSNIIAIPVLWYKGMPFTAGLTLFLFIVAIFGYFEWTKLYRAQSASAS